MYFKYVFNYLYFNYFTTLSMALVVLSNVDVGDPRYPIHGEYRKTSDRSPRLLSVQVSQTPGLYAGPGVYPGPGLCHNMSRL